MILNKAVLSVSFTKISLVFCIGYASTTCPMYVAECAPAEIRGKLITVYQMFITFGQFFASVIDGLFSKDEEHGWRYSIHLFNNVTLLFQHLFHPGVF